MRLAPALSRFVGGREFVRRGTVWRLRFPRPPVDRFEYQLELERRNGSRELVLDPTNPLRAPGPFGEKSVVEFPGYRPPAWLESTAKTGSLERILLPSRRLRARVRAALWVAAGAEPGEPLPLLVVHDGSETVELTSLLRFLDVLAASGLGPFRALLLDPVERDRDYSASALYARALERDLLPPVERLAPASTRAGMGASLGALALLHAHLRHPRLFGGLFLQSGSFFRGRTDPQESGFPHFSRITRFVGSVLRDAGPQHIPVTVTCGLAEENLTNNRAVAAALAGQGYDVRFGELRDAHTWTGWRDGFDPWLADLLERAWR